MFDIPAFSLPISLPERARPQGRITLALMGEEGAFARERLGGWSHPADKAYSPSSQAARALLRYMLRGEVDASRQRSILRDPTGRPVLEAGAREVTPVISISHANGFVAAAYGFVPGLGLDLECSAKERDIAGIAELAFGPAERRQVAQDGPKAFYRIWTGREALAKATGRAFAQLTDRCDYLAGPVSGGVMRAHVDETAWSVAHAKPSDQMFLSIAWRD
ncbi:hypothetical protein DWF00_18685 [Bosea caraganae]|uniref:4'-phosphopantetheinyl transferase domain-containing protein n=1 Tax=Bosea caraganae TaxID=2763117 RepID=A0A370L839_9HYPH|nr:4'-phosphopantetheinyl transferase superfamily protein [Bosea caraganae]RDJ25213.1 hypothetical protein DWF00_18685 [Bosea caraganae]RDJ26323.1 hypothetical protein DWE98_10905 [Bosea caraganae]